MVAYVCAFIFEPPSTFHHLKSFKILYVIIRVETKETEDPDSWKKINFSTCKKTTDDFPHKAFSFQRVGITLLTASPRLGGT